MLDLSDYPKKLPLRDGSEATVRPLELGDELKLMEFMSSIPYDESVYFRDDVRNPKVIEKWARHIDLERVMPLIALDGEKIIAEWTLHVNQHGWTRHHADIRGFVTPKYRGRGLATRMVKELLAVAGQLDVERVIIELVEPQQELLKRYQRIGFKVETVLKDWVKDLKGRLNDMYLLSMQLEPAWKKMESLVMEYEFRHHG